MLFSHSVFRAGFAVLLAMSFAGPVKAQPKIPEDLYVFDENMKGTTIENATYLLSVRKLGDSLWQWDTYNFKGPIIRMQTYSDHDGTVA